MNGYAIAHLKSVQMGQDIVDYLQRIDATLAPFGGRFIVHGGHAEIREGEFPGDLIVIGFPSREAAVSWYESDAYGEILPLRLDNAEGWAIIVDGVSDDHRATDVLEGSAPGG